VVEKIYISNVRMLDIPGDAINFTMYYGGKAPLEDSGAATEASAHPVTVETPQFRDIHIQNIVCRGAKNAMMLQGLPELPIRDIHLKDVAITSQQGVLLIDGEGITFENVRVDNATGDPLKTVRVKNSKLDLMK
jgi:hypothetical protein